MNYMKTNCVLFSKTSKNESAALKIATHSGFIETSCVVKFLGVFFDKNLNWETHAQFVLDKMCSAKGILCKLRHYASKSILKSVYFSLVYSYLQYSVMTWGNTTAKCLNKIQTQQNYLIKIITNAPWIKTKLSPLYEQLHLLNLSNIYQLKVLKFACKFKMKTLPKCFENYYQLASQVHIYSTRFAADENWSVPRFKKTYTQHSIKYKGTKLWNALPTDLRDKYLKSYAIFVNRLKQFLQCNQL